jgi:hypothetical protein
MEMVRSVVSKVMWVGRTTATLIGLAVALALVLGVATMALAAVPGDPFRLGQTNGIDAMSTLVGNVAGPMLMVDNNSTGAGATALDLRVEAGKPPMKVNSTTKVSKLNADKVDGKDGFMDDTTYLLSRPFTGVANTYNDAAISCDFEDKVLSGGYFLNNGTASKVTLDRASGITYDFEVLSGPSAETGTIFALCADQDGDGAGTAAANVADSPQALLEEERAARN